MFGSFLITLREGFEMVLLISIILAFLIKTNERDNIRWVWYGTASAVILSLLAGGLVFFIAGELGDPGEAIFEGIALLSAAALLAWMIFWMRRQSARLKTELQVQVKSIVAKGSKFGLALIAFIAVAREGIETVLFLFAAKSTSGSPLLFILGGLAGLAAAVIIGYVIFKNVARLNIKRFFYITGIIIIVFAAGLMAQGVHELNEVNIIPSVVEHVWDTNGAISESSVPGQFLKSVFGYNGNPSLTEIAAYLVYLFSILALYLRPNRLNNKPVERPCRVNQASESRIKTC